MDDTTTRRGTVFIWTNAEGRRTIFDVDAIKEVCGRTLPIVTLQPSHFGPGYFEMLRDVNDIDEKHARSLPEEALAEPVVYVVGQTGWVLVDGSHRVWRLLSERRTVPAYLLPWDAAVALFAVPDGDFLPIEPAHNPETYDAAEHHARAMKHFRQ